MFSIKLTFDFRLTLHRTLRHLSSFPTRRSSDLCTRDDGWDGNVGWSGAAGCAAATILCGTRATREDEYKKLRREMGVMQSFYGDEPHRCQPELCERRRPAQSTG